MKTLIIYNKNDGNIFVTQSTGTDIDIEDGTVTNICVDVPEGQVLKGIDVSATPNVPILEVIPKSELELLKEQVNNLAQANAELTSIVEMGNTNA